MDKSFSAHPNILREALNTIGYREIKSNHFKKGIFHFIIKGVFKRKTRLSGHVDYPRQFWDRRRHKAVFEDTRLKVEINRIADAIQLINYYSHT